jgi:hypothetical protein
MKLFPKSFGRNSFVRSIPGLLGLDVANAVRALAADDGVVGDHDALRGLQQGVNVTITIFCNYDRYYAKIDLFSLKILCYET